MSNTKLVLPDDNTPIITYSPFNLTELHNSSDGNVIDNRLHYSKSTPMVGDKDGNSNRCSVNNTVEFYEDSNNNNGNSNIIMNAKPVYLQGYQSLYKCKVNCILTNNELQNGCDPAACHLIGNITKEIKLPENHRVIHYCIPPQADGRAQITVGPYIQQHQHNNIIINSDSDTNNQNASRHAVIALPSTQSGQDNSIIKEARLAGITNIAQSTPITVNGPEFGPATLTSQCTNHPGFLTGSTESVTSTPVLITNSLNNYGNGVSTVTSSSGNNSGNVMFTSAFSSPVASGLNEDSIYESSQNNLQDSSSPLASSEQKSQDSPLVAKKKRTFLSPQDKAQVAKLIRMNGLSYMLRPENLKIHKISPRIVKSIDKQQKRYKSLSEYEKNLATRAHNKGRKSVVQTKFLDFARDYFQMWPNKTVKSCVLALKAEFPDEKIPARSTLNEAMLNDQCRSYGTRFTK